jgi:hypothetical protein
VAYFFEINRPETHDEVNMCSGIGEELVGTEVLGNEYGMEALPKIRVNDVRVLWSAGELARIVPSRVMTVL